MIDELSSFVISMKLICMLSLLLILSILCGCFHINTKETGYILMYSTLIFFHKYIFSFPRLYVSYSILVILGIGYVVHGVILRYR